jgi:UDP-N-acetylglucosamine 4-epimerase
VYGDHPGLPKIESVIGEPLSPYAATKRIDELYAGVFARSFGLSATGLRYFKVFGARQDPDGAYAAVIPRWAAALLAGETVWINGDGETSRDFCYVANVVQANLLAACSEHSLAQGEVYNVAVGERTTLNQLFHALRAALAARETGNAGKPGMAQDFAAPPAANASDPGSDWADSVFAAQYGVEAAAPLPFSDPAAAPAYREFRAGDVRHSLADISKAQQLLGYAPTHTLAQGLRAAIAWYVERTLAPPGR